MMRLRKENGLKIHIFRSKCYRILIKIWRIIAIELNITDAFKDKVLVITGGTGSFGSTVLKHFLTTDIGEIRIFSRDEKKQDWIRHTLQAQYPKYAS